MKIPSNLTSAKAHSTITSEQLAAIKSGAIILAQTDTTAGFLSTSAAAINAAKARPAGQNCLRVYASCAALQRDARLCARAKNFARKARRTSILQGSFGARVVRDCAHARLLQALERAGVCGLFSSSANAHGAGFSANFAAHAARYFAQDLPATTEPAATGATDTATTADNTAEQSTKSAATEPAATADNSVSTATATATAGAEQSAKSTATAGFSLIVPTPSFALIAPTPELAATLKDSAPSTLLLFSPRGRRIKKLR